VFFASVSGTVTSHRDPEEQLLLGGGQRPAWLPPALPSRRSKCSWSRSEQRFYTDWQPLKLFNVGAAVFVDSGRTWGRDEFAAPPAGWLTDVGSGLRLGSVRSGLGNVLHIDLAFSAEPHQRHRQPAAPRRNAEVLLSRMQSFKFWWAHLQAPLVLFVVLAGVFATTPLDVTIARTVFFDAPHAQWIGAHSWIINELVHTGGRWAVRVLLAIVLAFWIATWVERDWRQLRRPAAFFLVSALLSIGVVGLLKTLTNVDCPWDLADVRRPVPVYRAVRRPARCVACRTVLPRSTRQLAVTRCSPYSFTFRERHSGLAKLGLALGLLTGLVFGLAQQARGAHFVSHDLWSAFLVWTVTVSVYAFAFRARLWDCSAYDASNEGSVAARQLAPGVHAAGGSSSAQELLGRRISDVLDELRSTGLTFIYNTQILPNDLRIETEPRAREGVELAREILAARGLSLSTVAPGVFAVVAGQQPQPAPETPAEDAATTVEEVVVQTSRYRLATGEVAQRTFLTQEQVKNMRASRMKRCAPCSGCRAPPPTVSPASARCAAASRTRPRSCSTGCACTSHFI
jgi:membrane-associated PAP2 superfamily phosphatase